MTTFINAALIAGQIACGVAALGILAGAGLLLVLDELDDRRAHLHIGHTGRHCPTCRKDR